jgi:carboxyl-terminal processing protease
MSPRPQTPRMNLRPTQPSSLLRSGILALAALALLPASLQQPAAAPDVDERQERENFRRRLAEMVEAVEVHYVDPDIDEAEVVQGAIRGMLDTLDPHTSFLSQDAYRGMRESQDGAFYGLGIIISVRQDRNGMRRLTVISPVDGTPAKRVGVRTGDIIAAINGESTDDLSLDGAVTLLRGKKDTTVTVSIERGAEIFDLVIARAEIPSESIRHAYMIEPGTGFIRIKDFTRTTKRELDEAIARLRKEGMERLILDLRDNPGGLLDSAVEVSATFLEPGSLVVETKGRLPGTNERHVSPAGMQALSPDTPMVLMLNRGSASGSEIVAGAIQDHDRGLVVGGTSWGKGLVQSVYNLSYDAGLALTTARYYTPSGRQIQRDYRSSYYDYHFPRRDARPEGEVHRTEGGRIVQSGGGIEPDVAVEERSPAIIVRRMIGQSIFFRFAEHHENGSLREVTFEVPVVDEDLAAFKVFAGTQNLEFTDEEWVEALPQIRVQVAYELATRYLGWKQGFKVLNGADPQVQAALRSFPHASRTALLRDAKDGNDLSVVIGGTTESEN